MTKFVKCILGGKIAPQVRTTGLRQLIAVPFYSWVTEWIEDLEYRKCSTDRQNGDNLASVGILGGNAF